MNKTKPAYRYFAAGIIAIVLCELFVFNYAFFASRILPGNTQAAKVVYANDASEEEDGFYSVSKGSNYIILDNINSRANYIYLDATLLFKNETNKTWTQNDYTANIYCIDEGYSEWYKMGSRFINSEKSKYLRLHTYGKVKAVKIEFEYTIFPNGQYSYNDVPAAKPDSSEEVCGIKINSAIVNPKIPLMVSPLRIAAGFALMIFVYLFRSESRLFKTKADFTNKRQRALLLSCIVIFSVFFAGVFFVRYAMNSFNPLLSDEPSASWQYYLLAKSLAEGKLNIDYPGVPQGFFKLSNPYDTLTRLKALGSEDYNQMLDIAYFNGKFYVYFGIAPCLIFYLPWYLLFKKPFPIMMGQGFLAVVFVILMYLLIKFAVKKYFRNISIGTYLLIYIVSVLSSILILCFSKVFYTFVQLTGAVLSMAGILLWLKSAEKFKAAQTAVQNNAPPAIKTKGTAAQLVLGSLCMALVAGCRPQMCLMSFVCFPVFLPLLFKKSSGKSAGKKAAYLILFAIPYIIVAAGLMYYNYARFGSPFDFGANYNITSNDMTHRGFYPGRLPSGVFVQLFLLPRFSSWYPYVDQFFPTSRYLGITVHEFTYGGLFTTSPFLLSVFMLPKLRRGLKKKGLYALCVTAFAMAMLIVCVDIEGAGNLTRYWIDYAWAFALIACVAVLALSDLYSQNREYKVSKRINTGLVAVLIYTVFVNLFGMASEGLFNVFGTI